jgi:hypothetical protein
MRTLNPWLLLVLVECWPGVALAQLQLLPDEEPQCVFSGEKRPIAVVWQNVSDRTVDTEIRARLYQTTSATAVQLGETLWKQLKMLPGQTVLESAQLDFPAVRVETRFLVQWLGNSKDVLGTTSVRIYPTNLLAELQPLVEDQSLGVFDPQNELKPLLKSSKVGFVDLGNSELEHFSGKLAVVGPFASKSQIPDGLAKRIKLLAQKGAAVVWIVPPDSSDEPQPSFYLVPEGLGVVVVVQAAMVSDLPANPRSQLNLLFFCKLALHPQFLTLPDLSLEP